ncbi:hypothetical protein CFC21_008091 [Triticum aestivum]|uniref:Uncharacterized protein n=1 Tax=Triticum aestivum TaxID=4565 RepID=A0A9R1ISC2_WHEAT|nr:hypothetical protein CFC21_008091 [Triticum aestivum]
MKHSMDTSGFSRDSFPSPSPSPAAPSLPGGVSVYSCSGACGAGGDAQCVGGPCGCGFAATGGWGGASCVRGGVGARPHGLAGTGGFRCAHGAEPAASRRWSCARFAAGDGDLRPGSRRGGGGDGDARPRLPGTAAPWSRSRLARLGSPPGAALPCRHLGGLDGERSGPATVVAADDSDAASDFSSTERAGLLTLPPTPCPSFALAVPPSLALAFSADGATTAPPATRLGLGRGLTRGVSESTSLTFSSSGGGRSRASTAFLPSAAPGGSPRFLLTQQPMPAPSFPLLPGF